MTKPSSNDKADGLKAAQLLSVLCNLIIDACRSESRKALVFKILNNTVHLLHYDRAILWQLEGRRPVMLGVSGQLEASKATQLAQELRDIVGHIEKPEEPARLGADSFPEIKERWLSLAEPTSGLSVSWVPMTSHGRLVAGLWLERWGDRGWDDNELGIMVNLGNGYGAAWERFSSQRPWRSRLPSRAIRFTLSLLIMVAAAYFFVIRTSPLRLVAPCEVIPKDPFVVTAPLDGVVEKVLVEPGQAVKEGDLLFVYDKQVALQELEVAKQKVAVVRAQLERSTALAFSEREALDETVILKHRLKQEQLRLKLARYIASRLDVRAERKGVIMISDPYAWRGRPVRTGERVMTVIDPAKTTVRIWLAQDDNVGLDMKRPLEVFLHASPHRSQQARITYVSPSTEISPAGVPSFVVEAEWRKPPTMVRPGLKGTAILYGPETSLAYWILRKPWSSLRQAVGK